MTSRERYAEVDLRRIVEAPKDALEEEYSNQVANEDARRVWDRLAKSPRHRERVIRLLAKEALDTMPRQEPAPSGTGLLDE